ncbi:MAG: hypothetical protein AAGD14_10650 [Planctomycetota bacterium]
MTETRAAASTPKSRTGTLRIEVRGSDGSRPEPTHIALFRGDTYVGALVDRSAREFKGLVPGRYRVFICENRGRHASPPAFDVRVGVQTRIVYRDPAPRNHAWLEVLDARGRRIRTMCTGFTCYYSESFHTPCGKALISSFGHGDGDGAEISAAEDGRFDLGEGVQDGDGQVTSGSSRLHLDGHSEVHLRLRTDFAGDRTYRALCLPLQPIRDSVVVKPGVELRLSATCVAQPAESMDASKLFVDVKARAYGYRAIRFRVYAHEIDDLPKRVLRPYARDG